MKIEKIFEKYGILILICWIVLISMIGFTFGCTPKDTTKTVEKHTVIEVKRDYHNNPVHPIEPVFKITLKDSSSFRTAGHYNIGDTVTYIIYTLKK